MKKRGFGRILALVLITQEYALICLFIRTTNKITFQFTVDPQEAPSMSIKPDKWIRRMAQEHGMIEPFEPGQVKEIDGRRVVSYGTSSYGYDVRCADEFKLFTNVYSAIVDPKKFDDKSFVDMKGDHVIIPPNSFALARTLEYFRIPRNVMTICLGKSTYARFS